jgi:hypothetical protein
MNSEGKVGRNSGANGFRFAGNIIGLAGGSAKISARGREVTFSHDARIVLPTKPRNSSLLQPNAARPNAAESFTSTKLER